MSTTSRSPSPATGNGKQPDTADRSPSPQFDKAEAEAAAKSDSQHESQGASEGASEGTPDAPVASSSTAASPAPSAVPTPTATNGDWQAIWSPTHNAYYFYNARTQETTWTNPFQPAPTDGASVDPSAAAGSSPAAPTYDLQAAAAAEGIDPALAYLDPSLAAGPSNPAALTYTAKFNARTGAFTRPDGRDPSHLSEYERAKRMSEFYFDVNAWEREVETRKLEEAHEEETKKRKRPTKKDLERFKEQKRLKKIAKTAWLRT